MPEPHLRPEQLRMARVGLGLTTHQVGKLAKVRASTVSDAERGGRSQGHHRHQQTLAKLRVALEAAGAEFKPGGWVRAVAAALRLGGKADSPTDAAKPDESGL